MYKTLIISVSSERNRLININSEINLNYLSKLIKLFKNTVYSGDTHDFLKRKTSPCASWEDKTTDAIWKPDECNIPEMPRFAEKLVLYSNWVIMSFKNAIIDNGTYCNVWMISMKTDVDGWYTIIVHEPKHTNELELIHYSPQCSNHTSECGLLSNFNLTVKRNAW